MDREGKPSLHPSLRDPDLVEADALHTAKYLCGAIHSESCKKKNTLSQPEEHEGVH
jgi:hypothetical protein